MPLNPAALAQMIEAKFRTIPIGQFPTSTQISATPQEDGTVDPQSEVTTQDVFMDPKVAKVIAQAVAESVVTHILTAAVVIGGGTLGPGKVT